MDRSLPLRLVSLQQALVRRACGWIVGVASTLAVARGRSGAPAPGGPNGAPGHAPMDMPR